jgi:sugar phosphate isomerase/epimerase
MEVPIRILPNPNIETTAADFEEQQKLLVQIDGVLTDIHQNVVRMRSVQSQLQHYAKVLQGRSQYKTLLEKANEIEILLNAWESDLIQSDQKTFQDVINFNNKLNAEWMNLKSYVDAEDPKVTQGARDRFADLMEAWKQSKEELEALIAKDFKEFENAFQAAKVPALVIPD